MNTDKNFVENVAYRLRNNFTYKFKLEIYRVQRPVAQDIDFVSFYRAKVKGN